MRKNQKNFIFGFFNISIKSGITLVKQFEMLYLFNFKEDILENEFSKNVNATF